MIYEKLPHSHHSHDNIHAIKKELENIPDFQILSDIFKQLGDTNRLRIFWLLCHCEECVINISSLVNMSSPAVSHHLRSLKSFGLLSWRRDGKEVFYKASDSNQSKLLHQMIEQSMEISCPNRLTITPIDHSELIHHIHEYLLDNLDQKITIEALSKKFAINTTTLKEVFKSVYGTSLAAHMKEHRMQEAKRLLSETDLSIAEIATKVGFSSQSRFSDAFKEFYKILPSKFRGEK